MSVVIRVDSSDSNVSGGMTFLGIRRKDLFVTTKSIRQGGTLTGTGYGTLVFLAGPLGTGLRSLYYVTLYYLVFSSLYYSMKYGDS